MDLSRYTGKFTPNIEDNSEDDQSYGLGKENQIIFMLEFCLKKGISFALPYDHVTEIAYDSDSAEEIVIGYPDRDIRLKGVNLKPIWTNLLFRQIKWIRESDSKNGREKEPCIYEILNEKYEEN